MDDQLGARRSRALALGGPDQIRREHERGRLTIRERIDQLVDPGTFVEIGTFTTLPVADVYGRITAVLPTPYVGGFAEIGGRPVVVGGEDFTVNFGAPSQHLEKFKGGFSGYIEEMAHAYRLPLVLLLHGAGGDVGFADAVGFTAVPSEHDVFPMAELLGVVPVVAAVLGVVGGGAGARAVATHLSIMSRPQGLMFAAGPAIVERALGRRVDKAELGGVDVHVALSGNVDNVAEDEHDALAQIRRFVSFLPTNVDHLPPDAEPLAPDPDIATPSVTPDDPTYDPVDLIGSIVDAGSWFGIGEEYGRALVTGLARVSGRTVGVLAHDPRVAGGAMDGLAADKQVRFVQLCDTFHVPIVFLVNTPGVAAGEADEAGGVLRRVVRAIEAMHRAATPVLSVHVGVCDGLAGMATSTPNRLAMRVAWPSASFGSGGGLSTEARDPEPPWTTAEFFGVEEVIAPSATRRFVEAWLSFTAASRRAGSRTGPQFRP